MKKIMLIFFVLLVLFFLGCSLDIRDREGFRLYQYGSFITETNVCVQSQDVFMVGEEYVTESIIEKPVVITNVYNRDVIIKITDYEKGSRYVVLLPLDSAILL